MAVEKLIGPKFDPENDKIDKRILYEVTGRRQHGDDLFSDTESSSDDDSDSDSDDDGKDKVSKGVSNTSNLLSIGTARKAGDRRGSGLSS